MSKTIQFCELQTAYTRLYSTLQALPYRHYLTGSTAHAGLEAAGVSARRPRGYEAGMIFDALLLGWLALVLPLGLSAAVGSRAPRAIGPPIGLLGSITTAILPQLLLGELLLFGLSLGYAAPATAIGVGLGGLPLLLTGLRAHRVRLRPTAADGPAGAGSALPRTGTGGGRLRLWGWGLLLRAPARAEVRRETVRGWRSGAGWSLDLDLYRPASPAIEPGHPRPAILFLHGGAWVAGSRAQNWYYCTELAASGFVVCSASYRLAPRFPLQAAVSDAKAAVAYLREHAVALGVDPDRIGVIGASAGGHLASMVALTAGDSSLQPGFEDRDCSVQSAVSMYGVADLLWPTVTRPHALTRTFLERWIVQEKASATPDLYRRLSPAHRASANAPPFLLVHGDQDALVPLKESGRLHQALVLVGADVSLLVAVGATHAFTVHPSPPAAQALQAILRHFEATLRPPAGRASDAPPTAATEDP